MSDSLFKKAVSDKMNAGDTPPDDFIWANIDAALEQKRAAKRKRHRLLLPLFLVFSGVVGIFFFGKKEVGNFDKKTATITTQNESNENISFIKTDSNKTDLRLTNNDLGLSIEAAEQSKIVNPKLPISNQTNITLNEQSTHHLISNIDKEQIPKNIEIEKTASSNQREILPLFAKINLKNSVLNYQPKFEISTFNFEAKPNKIKPISKRKKFALATSFESNKLAYCFDEKANHLATKVEAEYRITNRLAVGTSIGFHQTNHQFEVNETEHLEAFGNTDKYPEFYKFSRTVETIRSDLKYISGSISAAFHQPISKNWTTAIGASQDFIFHQNQKITYDFFNGTKDLEIKNQSTDFNIGMTNFSLEIHRSLGERLTAGLRFNRYISTRTIGVERQYYHGFGGGVSVGFSF